MFSPSGILRKRQSNVYVEILRKYKPCRLTVWQRDSVGLQVVRWLPFALSVVQLQRVQQSWEATLDTGFWKVLRILKFESWPFNALRIPEFWSKS